MYWVCAMVPMPVNKVPVPSIKRDASVAAAAESAHDAFAYMEDRAKSAESCMMSI